MLDALQAALAQARALGWRSALPSERVSAGARREGQGERVAADDTVAQAAGRARALLAEIDGRLAAAPRAERARQSRRQARPGRDRSHPRHPGQVVPGAAALHAGRLRGRSPPRRWPIATTLLRRRRPRDRRLAAQARLRARDHRRARRCAHRRRGDGQCRSARRLKLLQFPRDAGVRAGARCRQPPSRTCAASSPSRRTRRGARRDRLRRTRLAGLFVDEWSESIPAPRRRPASASTSTRPARARRRHPARRAGRPSGRNWTLDGLVDVVNEAMALARLRAVRPQDLQGLGLMLPGHLPVEQLQAGRADARLRQDARQELCAARAATDTKMNEVQGHHQSPPAADGNRPRPIY